MIIEDYKIKPAKNIRQLADIEKEKIIKNKGQLLCNCPLPLGSGLSLFSV